MVYVEGQTLRDLLDELDFVPEEPHRYVGHGTESLSGIAGRATSR